jgi:hypothetical protein
MSWREEGRALGPRRSPAIDPSRHGGSLVPAMASSVPASPERIEPTLTPADGPAIGSLLRTGRFAAAVVSVGWAMAISPRVRRRPIGLACAFAPSLEKRVRPRMNAEPIDVKMGARSFFEEGISAR